jgi:hypothetical protein
VIAAAAARAAELFVRRQGVVFVTFRTYLLSGAALALMSSISGRSVADEGTERLIVKVIGPGDRFAVGGELPVLVQVTGKGALVSSEGAPVSREGFLRLTADPKAQKRKDGRAAFVLDFVDKDTPLTAVSSLINDVRASLPKEARVTLLIRFDF